MVTIIVGERKKNTGVGKGKMVTTNVTCKKQSLRVINRAQVIVEEDAGISARGKHNYTVRGGSNISRDEAPANCHCNHVHRHRWTHQLILVSPNIHLSGVPITPCPYIVD